jgi:ABC-type sugar transport system ATPase subunit
MQMTLMDSEPLLRLSAVSKGFPGVQALSRVDLALHRGEIHALLGENGAGKSTLIRVLTGIHPPDEGSYHLAGKPVQVDSPKSAIAHGVTVVPQDILMVPEFSIGRNILLGMEGFSSRRERLSRVEEELVAAALARVGADFSPNTRTADLAVPHRRLAQIARALIQPGDVMILDEPTAVLSEPDAEHLLTRLEQFRAEGKAILYVTHRLSEVMRLADRVTILRDGHRVGCYRRGDIDRAEIVALMAKEGAVAEVTTVRRETPVNPNEFPRLKVDKLSLDARFNDVSFNAIRGEIVGIAGVQGSGHGSLLRSIAGVDLHDEGRIMIDGETLYNNSPRRAMRRGVLFVPADRRNAAIVPNLPIRANIALSARVRKSVRRFGLRWHGTERAVAQGYVDAMTIRPGNADTPIGTLSGGNQQKVVIARALEGKAEVLLVEEPTQGVDVRAKAEIHMLLRRAAYEEGCTVVIATSEFDELLGLADRIYVMQSGRLVKELEGRTASYTAILEHALP